MKKFNKYVGLDTHKETIAVAIADSQGSKTRFYGEIPNTRDAVDKLMHSVSPQGEVVSFCYEAGPCGYELFRQITGAGHECLVAAPSLIPAKPGDRVKTDRRDAENLARLHRADELTGVWVPDCEQEAIRDLTRAREDIKQLEREMAKAMEGWTLGPVAEGLMALRGCRLITAMTVVAELGDISRFETPRQLMKYLGLVPSEHSSGAKVQRGGITKTGNTHVRRILTESAWTYRFPARKTGPLQRRAEQTSEAVQAIAWKAQKRLCGRYQSLNARGVQKNKVCTAVARELSGFMWAIACEVMDSGSVKPPAVPQ